MSCMSYIAPNGRIRQSDVTADPPTSWIGPVNILTREQQIAAISALVEGVSIRATERLTGIHRDTIMRLGVRIGEGCAAVHDHLFRGLQIG